MSLLFSIVTIGFLSLFQDANAVAFVITDQPTCEALSASTSWSGFTCTLTDTLTIPTSDKLVINNGVTLVISPTGNLIIDGELSNKGIITNNGSFTNNGDSFLNFGIFNNAGTFTNNGLVVSNAQSGNINNSGFFYNENSFELSSSGVFTNTREVTNNGYMQIDGILINNSTAFLYNNGTIVVNFFENHNYVENNSSIDIYGIFNNNPGSIFDIAGAVTLDNAGTFNNISLSPNISQVIFQINSTLEIDGVWNNLSSSTFENYGNILLGAHGTLNNSGMLLNESTIEITRIGNYFGILNNFSTGTLTNNNVITNSGGQIINTGIIDGSGGIVDDSQLVLTIISPSNGASFDDITDIEFTATAIDPDEFGNPISFSDNIEWTDNGNTLFTGSTFSTTLSSTPSTHNIKTTVLDSDGIEFSKSIIISIGIVDFDGDGHSPLSAGGSDCNDANNTMFPGNPEIIDGLDNDCVAGIPANETDDDADTYIESLFSSLTWKGDPSVVGGSDCNDANNTMFPGNPEISDGLDNDCDLVIDNGFDNDQDGYTQYGGDCDDTNPTIHPGALEIPDFLDNDCDGDGLFNDDLEHVFVIPENLTDDLFSMQESKFEKMIKHWNDDIEKLKKANIRLEEQAQKEEDKGNQDKADELRLEIAENLDKINILEMEVLVLEMSIGKTPVDLSQTIIIKYDNLSEKSIKKITQQIEYWNSAIKNLNEKADYLEKIAQKYEAKGDERKAQKLFDLVDSLRATAEVYDDLNDVLKYGISYMPENNHDAKVHSGESSYGKVFHLHPSSDDDYDD